MVFFSKQHKDNMCGLHCMNALLQGPYFDEGSLSEIAVALDKEEAELLGGEANLEFKNVAPDGNYNIQVLSKALKQFGDIEVVPFYSKENEELVMTEEQGFICHNGDHWVAIRKINGVWYNVNSTCVLPPGPQTISDFMLDAIMAQVNENGFDIFIVRPP